MASKADRTLVEALGVPASGLAPLSFSATTASGLLESNSTYRFAATEDCYFKLVPEPNYTNPTSSDSLFFGGVPEIFQTDGVRVRLMVVQRSTSGTLHVTKMNQPGK